jgi:Cd2+/Zn2+-exporting ATPase
MSKNSSASAFAMSRNDDAVYIVSGVCCSTEEGVLRKALDSSIGAGTYEFSSLTSELRLSAGASGELALRRLRQAGFDGREKHALVPPSPWLVRHGDVVVAALLVLLTIAGILMQGRGAMTCFAATVAMGGWRIFRRAVGALRTLALDMNVLMAVAVAGALAIGKWEEASAVVALFAISLALESYSNERTKTALRALMHLAPPQASVITPTGEQTMDAADVEPGMLVTVRPGERLPVDGIITDGASTVNEAPLTGESAPVSKEAGMPAYAGTLNGNGALVIRTTRRAGDSAIAHIAMLVEQSQSRRAPVQNLVDRFARIYTPAVFALAVLITAIPPLLFGADAGESLYRALVLLVIACPCALVISTPVAIISAVSRAAGSGILIKGGVHVETLSRVRAMAIDKTGTLTRGLPDITDVVPLNSLSRSDVIAAAAALESRSEHHFAGAVLRCARTAGIPFENLAVEGFEAAPGEGVRGRVGGIPYVLGTPAMHAKAGALTTEARDACNRFAREGKSGVILSSGKQPVAILAFRDGLRHGGSGALRTLRGMGIARIAMLSGDNREVTELIAAELGLTEVRAALLPGDKVRLIEEMKRAEGTVAMVGDGINDAPALAAASVGIAMGVAGTDAALETADVVLMSDDLHQLPFLFELSRRSMRIVRQNIVLALGVKLLFLVLALGGAATLWMAILADDGAALAVILNALRVLGTREKSP